MPDHFSDQPIQDYFFKVYAMKSTATWVLILGLCCLNTAFAMRCGHNLVDVGDYKNEVLAKCGQPDSVETHTKIVGRTLHYPYRTLDLQQYEEVQVEEWIYNLGSSRFQQYLRFENGELKEVKSLGRGH
ncbi:MAG: DUF2845 domain-containing protein [Methylococcaceae bacterium]